MITSIESGMVSKDIPVTIFRCNDQRWGRVFADDYGKDSCKAKDTVEKMNFYAEYVNNELKEECLFEVI